MARAVALTALLTAGPLTVAAPAQAVTELSGCTVDPKRPAASGHNESNEVLVKARFTVGCPLAAGRPTKTVTIEQTLYEGSDASGAAFASRTWSVAFPAPSSTNKSRELTDAVLPDTSLLWERVYQRTRFKVTAAGVTSPWTNWEKSGARYIRY